MAQFSLKEFIDIGTHSYHTATSWRVTYDRAGTRIIDESLRDKVNLYHWISPLPNGRGGFHADLNEVHLWVRVHTLETDSDWTYIGYGNQNDQTFVYTENNSIVKVVNSLLAGIK